MAITVAQALRTERVLDALRNPSSPCALVTRDGQRPRIPGVEVVRGDLLMIAEGNRVAALTTLASASVPEECNVPINPAHPHIATIKAAKSRRWLYDARLRPRVAR